MQTLADDGRDALWAVITERLDRPVPIEVAAVAETVRRRFGDALEGVLAYGSCLRDADPHDGLIDLYALVRDYRSAQLGGLSGLLNRILPPNVYYIEAEHAGRRLRAKVAVVSLEQFERKVSAFTSYFWARFAQPALIVEARNVEARRRITRALVTATETLLARARLLIEGSPDALRVWTAVLGASYRTELRSEDAERARRIVEHDLGYYEAVTRAVFRSLPVPAAHERRAERRAWLVRRIVGKALSTARLVKAAFTFDGGAEYLVWKIERHSGVSIELTPWQKRHPLLAAVTIAPRLYFRGGFR